MGDQIKQTFQKLKAFWTALSPKIKKLCIFGFIGLLVLAVALTVFLNVKAGKYTVLFPNLESGKVQETMQTVQEMGYQVRLNGEGRLEVRSDEYDDIVARVATEYFPKSTLGYERYDLASGLTATDADKRQYQVQDAQDRLQAIIRRLGGVENVAVMLNLPETNVKIWEKTQPKGSASVTLTLQEDVKFTPQQVSSVKWLVAISVPGIQPEDVVVIDARTSLTLKGVDDQDPDSMDSMMQRMEFETRLEEKLEEKARQVLSVIFRPEDIRVAATVRLDYDKIKTEEMNYKAAETSTNNSGVLQHADQSAASGTSAPAQGVPGEDPNTDALPQYVNNQTDGGGYSESDSSFDYLVPYEMKQIEKDPAKYTDATISVTLNATPDMLPEETRESIVQSVAMATHIPTENISVANYSMEEAIPTPPEKSAFEQFIENPMNLIMVGAGFLVFLLLLIIILVLVGRARKKKQQEEVLEAATADVIELQEEDDTEFNLQQELEERKRQLRESSAKTADEAIADEVREFAKSNPEITANLLRAWMKEEID